MKLKYERETEPIKEPRTWTWNTISSPMFLEPEFQFTNAQIVNWIRQANALARPVGYPLPNWVNVHVDQIPVNDNL